MAIKSVSAWPEYRSDVQRMIGWFGDKLKSLGTEIELIDLGTETLRDGRVISLPKAILGTLGNVSIYFSI